jgi:hypothetical protein
MASKMASARGQVLPLPRLGEKTAAAAVTEPEFNPIEDALWHVLGGGQEEKLAYADPCKPLKDLQDKLAGAAQQLDSELNSLEVDYAEAGDRLYQQVKQAALEGTALGDVVAAWSEVSPSAEHVKVAFQLMTPRLRREGVFPSYDALGASLTKVGSAERMTNIEHPIVTAFGDFCTVLNKLASLREMQLELEEGRAKTAALLKQALGGALGKAWGALGSAGQTAGPAVGRAAEYLVGANPAAVAPIASKAIQYGGAGAAVLGANALSQQVTDRPVVNKLQGAALSAVPGTQEYNMRRYRLQMGQ